MRGGVFGLMILWAVLWAVAVAPAAAREAPAAPQEAPAAPQEAPRISVRVRQVAGSSVYLDVGTRHGLATGDTLSVAHGESRDWIGRLWVTASSETRAVLTYTEAPFPITRGEFLTLQLLREPAERPDEPSVRQAPPARSSSTPAPRTTRPATANTGTQPAIQERPPAHGRVSLALSSTRSSTTFGGSDAVNVPRTFATPAFRFDLTAPQAVGGFTLRTSSRVAYRYSSTDVFQPTATLRIYSAVLEREFEVAPVRVALGRFHSPVESYSGYWDGAFVRVGSNGFGFGALVGFEPDRWNERPSTELPKASVFIDGRARGEGWRWQGDFSAHTVRPADSLPVHTFFGATQRVTVGRLFLSHDIQVDQDPEDGRWRLSRLRLRGSLALSENVDVRGGIARRESFLIYRLGSPFAARNDRLDAGLMLRTSVGYLSGDVGVSKDVAGNRTVGTTASYASVPAGRAGALGWNATVSRWSGAYGSTVSASPSVTLALDLARIRMGYRFNRSDYLERSSVTHGVEASLDRPLSPGMRMSLRTRIRFGRTLSSQSLDATLSRVF